MNKRAVVHSLLKDHSLKPKRVQGCAFAPANIALCKYWGKRDQELNLPTTPSLSISLGTWGATTTIVLKDTEEGLQDSIKLNNTVMPLDSVFAQNIIAFLDLFRPTPATQFGVETVVNIPIGAGLASSACGFAALVLALEDLFGWGLPRFALSILARLGSGSACRSLWQGFVEWQLGVDKHGMDSFGVPLKGSCWSEFRVGLLILNREQKQISSREAMLRSVSTSPFYSHWPTKHAVDFLGLKNAIDERNFIALGEISESNSLAMHALMLSSVPPVLYSGPDTIAAMQKVWKLRQQGFPLYFTQDAGPNLKLLFLEENETKVREAFPLVEIVAPFGTLEKECKPC